MQKINHAFTDGCTCSLVNLTLKQKQQQQHKKATKNKTTHSQENESGNNKTMGKDDPAISQARVVYLVP